MAYINKGQKEKKALTAPEKKIKVQLKTTVERYRDVFLKLGFDLPPVPLPERIRYPMSETVRELGGARRSGGSACRPSLSTEARSIRPR